MSALVVMLLLGFFLVIAASLTIWAALGLTQHAPAPTALPAREPTSESPVVVARPSNDDVRGARVKVSQHDSGHADAFERFVRSDRPKGGSDF